MSECYGRASLRCRVSYSRSRRWEGEVLACRCSSTYRFLDCQRLLQGDLLCVVAFSKLPTQPYAAGSHVWKDLESKNKDEPSFRVNSIETELQVAIQALKTVCIAATKLGPDLLCLDKLCVGQDKATSHDAVLDNDWQVQNMHNIYSIYFTSVVMPGCLFRLATASWVSWVSRWRILTQGKTCMMLWFLLPKLYWRRDIELIGSASCRVWVPRPERVLCLCFPLVTMMVWRMLSSGQASWGRPRSRFKMTRAMICGSGWRTPRLQLLALMAIWRSKAKRHPS